MKTLEVGKVKAEGISAASVPEVLDRENVAFVPVDTVNWKGFPYLPEVGFRIAYTDNAILLHFRVKEESVRAVAPHDNGAVWEDACVEFFSVPDGDGVYYNMECNCAGTLLVAAGKERENRTYAPQEVLDGVDRWSSLGRGVFGEKVGECCWEVALVIPFATFFMHAIDSLEGKRIPANFYKCGDKLRTPHFLSWNKIEIEKPDFHRPDFFGELHFI